MVEASSVTRHYNSKSGLLVRVRDALTAAGLAQGDLSAGQLAALDQFHSRGLAATIDMAQRLNVGAQDRVLDIGSGLGGPSRYLAATYGCQVEGVDLSPDYVEAARFLAERTGLSGKVRYQEANALALPFEDASFEVAWTQHVAMNIADRTGLYAEAHRVLKPGGRLAIYDIVAGGKGPLTFPVPWARGPETSFLLTSGEMRAALQAQGFEVVTWIDHTAAAIAWFAHTAAPTPSTAPGVTLQLAMGPQFELMRQNLGFNLQSGQAGLVEAIVQRQS